METYLITLRWYESITIGYIKAPNKPKAISKFLLNMIEQNRHLMNNLDEDIPFFYYDDEKTDRENVADYMWNKILHKEVSYHLFNMSKLEGLQFAHFDTHLDKIVSV